MAAASASELPLPAFKFLRMVCRLSDSVLRSWSGPEQSGGTTPAIGAESMLLARGVREGPLLSLGRERARPRLGWNGKLSTGAMRRLVFVAVMAAPRRDAKG